MLAAIDLGIQVVQPLYGAGLGEYTRGMAATCRGSAPGANYICKDVGGEFACLPCTSAELAVFRDLQEQLNRIVVSYKLGEKYRLDVDGRIGWRTTRTAGVGYEVTKGQFAAAPAGGPTTALINAFTIGTSAPGDVGMQSAVSQWASEIASYFQIAADAKGAPTKVAEKNPIIKKPSVTADEVKPPPTGTGMLVAVGAVALLAAVGLVGTAAYYQKPAKRGKRGRAGKAGRRGPRGRR